VSGTVRERSCVASHHITSHHITSHHITSHHITSHHITSRPAPVDSIACHNPRNRNNSSSSKIQTPKDTEQHAEESKRPRDPHSHTHTPHSHHTPCSATSSSNSRSSSGDHGPLFTPGARWLYHRSRHCLPMRPWICDATLAQLDMPAAMHLRMMASSCVVHGPFTSPGFSTCHNGHGSQTTHPTTQQQHNPTTKQ